jgi:uncharacterized protein
VRAKSGSKARIARVQLGIAKVPRIIWPWCGTACWLQIITDAIFYALAIPAVIFLGLAKGGFSGVATGATPLLALYLPPLEAAALLLPIVLCQDAISIHAYWREWSGWNLKILLPGAVFGLVLGYLFAAHVSDDTIRILIGLTTLIFVAGHGERFSVVCQSRRRTAVSGLYAAAAPIENDFVGTTAIFFAALNIIKIVPYAMLAQFTVKNVSTSLVLLPLAVVANLVGIWLIKVVPTAQFFRITYVLLFVLGSVLFCQGATHMFRTMTPFDLAQMTQHAWPLVCA